MKKHSRPAPLEALAPRHSGPVPWHLLLQWLREDGMITPEEAERTARRCSQAESAQSALERLASVGVARARDGVALDIEELTRFLAGRAGLQYLRIDPLKVDAGKVADAASPANAHIQALVSAELKLPDGRILHGRGVLEQLFIGPHAPSGFRELFDLA